MRGNKEKILKWVVVMPFGRSGADDFRTRGQGAVGMVFGDPDKPLDLNDINIRLSAKYRNELRLQKGQFVTLRFF